MRVGGERNLEGVVGVSVAALFVDGRVCQDPHKEAKTLPPSIHKLKCDN